MRASLRIARGAAASLLLLCALPLAAASIPQELEEAEQLAVRGQADAAIDGYRSLIERGVDAPELRYNLGTLYLEEGDVGRAVLHLKTALRQHPRLEDARYNLERALTLRSDELEGTPRGPSLTTQVASLVRSDEASLAFGVALCLFALALGLWPWTRARTSLRRAGTLAAGFLAVSLVLTALLLLARVHEDGRREAVVIDRDVSARAAPDLDAAVAFIAHAGLFGDIVAEENGFMRLRLENGLDAWFPRASLGVVGDPAR